MKYCNCPDCRTEECPNAKNPDMTDHIPDAGKMGGSDARCGAWWEIPHPGTLETLKCATFNEAMDKWFEGFNIPVLVVDGVREDFSKACDRIKRYYAFPNSMVNPQP